MLVEKSKENMTGHDNDYYYGNDDEYFAPERGPKIWVVVVIVAVTTFLVTSTGFVIAMRKNEAFNRAVRRTPAFKPITSSHSRSFRSLLNLPLEDYEEVSHVPVKG